MSNSACWAWPPSGPPRQCSGCKFLAETHRAQGWHRGQLDEIRKLDPGRVVWLEAESKKIGNVLLPEALFEAMHCSPVITIEAPMSERVRLWREDFKSSACRSASA